MRLAQLVYLLVCTPI
ncbi:hypothetical protein OIU78_019267 [Salix suchowensis]|nr:hypothetical protein OIU78_019267 [Salix suchowensis]